MSVRVASLFALSTVAAALHAGPWGSLFDGKSLAGWKPAGGTAPFTVVDGAIVGTAVAKTSDSYFATEATFGDFILEMEIKQEGAGNGGIQFRSERRPDFNNNGVFGYQYEIDPSERAWTGGLYDESRRGWLYPVDLNPPAKSLYKYGE